MVIFLEACVCVYIYISASATKTGLSRTWRSELGNPTSKANGRRALSWRFLTWCALRIYQWWGCGWSPLAEWWRFCSWVPPAPTRPRCPPRPPPGCGFPPQGSRENRGRSAWTLLRINKLINSKLKGGGLGLVSEFLTPLAGFPDLWAPLVSKAVENKLNERHDVTNKCFGWRTTFRLKVSFSSRGSHPRASGQSVSEVLFFFIWILEFLFCSQELQALTRCFGKRSRVPGSRTSCFFGL